MAPGSAELKPRTPAELGKPEPNASVPTVTCHFHAQMVSQANVGQFVTLEVTILREKIERAIGPTAQAAAVDGVDPDKKLIVQALAKERCRIEGENYREVSVPKPSKLMQITFQVVGTELGSGKIWIEVRQDAKTLVLLELLPVFVIGRPMVVATAAATFGPVREEPSRLMIRIYEIRLGGDSFRLRFNLECSEPDINLDVESVDYHVSREKYVAGLYADLDREWSVDDTDFVRLMGRLRAKGAALYSYLVPDKVRGVIWKYRARIGAIQVISEEPFLPWELAYLTDESGGDKGGECFLAELGLVRWLHNIPWPRSELTLRSKRARWVVPAYPDQRRELKAAKSEMAALAKLFPGGQEIAADSLEVASLIADGEAFDLLHFSCHGEASAERGWEAALLMAGQMNGESYKDDPFLAAQVDLEAQLLRADGSRPIIFLNACESGRAGRSLSGLGGFAKAFLAPKTRPHQGAGLFVGSLWTIADDAASIFAQTFYERLLAGDRLVDATRMARAAAKGQKETTWLAYTVYGHPYATVRSAD